MSFLKKRGYSRHILTKIKADGSIEKNGHPVGARELLQAGDILTVELPAEEPSAGIAPVPMKFEAVYEDEDLLVINKPADMPIHPSVNNHENTLANAVAAYYLERGEGFVYRCINRLDRDTTGLLIVAKNMLSAAVLSNMGKKREIEREYLALVKENPPARGTIDAPIARKEGSVLERCVDFENGESAVTHYRRLAYKDGYSLVSLKLETGRTHQIRVHMKYLGYPVTGDFLYHPDFSLTEHQALHSYRLAFTHPVTEQRMEFTALPPKEWSAWSGFTDGCLPESLALHRYGDSG
ncbi:MAG: RluA family pseudouridine synthase [Eubacteriales bacterium]|nr:RluA family pseudouridine synthase [Eubacteriales bacterium]